MRVELSHKHIRGHGIEIGGLHVPLPVLPGCIVDYVDRVPLDELHGHSDVKPAMASVIVDDAEKLEKFASSSQDFIIANHVLEHCHDPIHTLGMWLDVVRPGGIVYFALPEKNHTFDKPRAITTLDHLLKDFYEGPELRDREHYREWFHLIDHETGEYLEKHVEKAFQEKVNIHFHVFDLAAMKAMIAHPLIADLCDVLECAVNGSEVIWALKRKSATSSL